MTSVVIWLLVDMTTGVILDHEDSNWAVRDSTAVVSTTCALHLGLFLENFPTKFTQFNMMKLSEAGLEKPFKF